MLAKNNSMLDSSMFYVEDIYEESSSHNIELDFLSHFVESEPFIGILPLTSDLIGNLIPKKGGRLW